MKNKVMKGILVISGILLTAFIGFLIFVNFFVPVNQRTPRSEAKCNLASIATAEISYFSLNNSWSGSFEEIGWEPTGRTKYTCFLTPTEYIGRPPSELGLKLPVAFSAYGAPTPGASENGFTAVAIGNIDGDETLDVWWIDSRKSPHNSQNDMND